MKDSPYLLALASFVLAVVFVTGLSIVYGQTLNTGPEVALGIPVNIHHDLVGVVFVAIGGIAAWKGIEKYPAAVMGFGAGLIVQHVATEGLVLVSAI